MHPFFYAPPPSSPAALLQQFGGQAPGSSEEERAYAYQKFGFEFDVFDKLDVNGPTAHSLYRFLRAQQPASAPGAARPVPGGGGAGAIEWNYVKVCAAPCVWLRL